jgi:hypothetical protein
MQAVFGTRELNTTDYEAVSDDGIFCKVFVILTEITDEDCRQI